MAYAVPAPYRDAIRNGLTINWEITALAGGRPVQGAYNLQPVDGSVEDDGTRPDRRKLDLTLEYKAGLFDLLVPTGVMLQVTALPTYPNRAVARIPMGIYDIDRENSGEVQGTISIAASDKWARIKRARFLRPFTSTVGILVTEQIAMLVRGVFGADAPVINLASSQQVMSAVVWPQDRDKAITDLAASIGARVYFDRDGVFTIADQPTLSFVSDWTIDASAKTGVLTKMDRERTRDRTFNVVVGSTTSADPAHAFESVIVWDNDPTSPTYAGPDPVNRPDLAGDFGVVPYYFDSPLLTNATQAIQASQAVLATTVGLASKVNVGALANPAVDAYDVITVSPARERWDLPRAVERHIADQVTHRFTGGEQSINGRSTRNDDYT